jgi:tyrosine aminotransferase
VIITSGASGAIAIAIPALADAGHNILVPRPGFSLYATVCGHYGIECRYYDLLVCPNKLAVCGLSHSCLRMIII